jgi:PPOX class probable F420-dependent enzyme
MFKLDTSTKFGARVAKRLEDEQVIWLTTVRPDGIPQPNPVWFLWDGTSILIYSQPQAKKVSHIRQNPHVALNFNSTEDGSDVAIITGEAHIEENAQRVDSNPVYIEKYKQGMADIGQTADDMAREYSTIIRVTPRHLRGF